MRFKRSDRDDLEYVDGDPQGEHGGEQGAHDDRDAAEVGADVAVLLGGLRREDTGRAGAEGR